MNKHATSFRKCQALKVTKTTNFHELGEIVFLEEYSFAPFLRIIGKPGHYGEESFAEATTDDLRKYVQEIKDSNNE